MVRWRHEPRQRALKISKLFYTPGSHADKHGVQLRRPRRNVNEEHQI